MYLVAMVPTRRRHPLHRRRAFPLTALRAAHPARCVVELRIPPGETPRVCVGYIDECARIRIVDKSRIGRNRRSDG